MYTPLKQKGNHTAGPVPAAAESQGFLLMFQHIKFLATLIKFFIEFPNPLQERGIVRISKSLYQIFPRVNGKEFGDFIIYSA